jgi:aldehyde dehydrogenase (NAD+)
VDTVAVEARRIFNLQSAHKWQAKTSSLEHRKQLIRALRDVVIARAADIEDAIIEDLPQPRHHPMPREVEFLVAAAEDALRNLDDWARPIEVEPSSYFPNTSPSVVFEGRGVCLIFGPWNMPFLLVLEPLVAALAAGNTAILKPNSMTPRTAAICADIIRETFDERIVAIFEGGVEVAETLLELPVDHIFFTGSPAVGKIVMAAAARHLASVTLELGGKSPAIVDGTHDIADTAQLVAAGRHTNGGQMCFAVDYLWVHESVKDRFLAEYNAWVDANLFVDGELDPDSMPHIIDERNLARVLGLVDDARSRGATILRGGVRSVTQPDMIEPTVILGAPLDSELMTNEIFGPVLAVQTFVDLTTVLRHIQQAPKPLAMYIYSDDRAFVDSVLDNTSSGGVTVNGFGTHVGEYGIPFGGVNHSGTGRYHGIHGFREFSNQRSVVRHHADQPR